MLGSTAPPDAQDEDGDLGTWGPYRLLRTLGPGTLGRVVRATDHLHRDVVIRFLPTPSAPEVAVAFLATGQTLARVRHPNAVEVYGAEQHDDQTGLVMEYVDGRSLDQVVTSQGTFSAREAALVGWELCRAIAALHREGLAHGLLSPDNIVREAGGRLVLMDVWPPGVPLEALDLQAGTLPFLAPEVAGGGVALDAQRHLRPRRRPVLPRVRCVPGARLVARRSARPLPARRAQAPGRPETRPARRLHPDRRARLRSRPRTAVPDDRRGQGRAVADAGLGHVDAQASGHGVWRRPTWCRVPAPGCRRPCRRPRPPRRPARRCRTASSPSRSRAVAIGGSVAWSLLPRGTGLRGHSTSLATMGGVGGERRAVHERPAPTCGSRLGSAAGADPVLTPLVIEQLAQDLSSSPPFRVIAPIAVEPMLGQPIAAIMQAVGADVYVEVTVSRRDSGLQAQLNIVRAGAPTASHSGVLERRDPVARAHGVARAARRDRAGGDRGRGTPDPAHGAAARQPGGHAGLHRSARRGSGAAAARTSRRRPMRSAARRRPRRISSSPTPSGPRRSSRSTVTMRCRPTRRFRSRRT